MTGISIFMDSRMQISSPSATIWPSSTTTCQTFAVISALISAIPGSYASEPGPGGSWPIRRGRGGGSSDRQEAVLAPRAVDAFVGGDPEAARDRGSCLGRVDDVVELRVSRRDVGIDVGPDLFRELEPLPGALGFVFDRRERAAVDDVDRAVGTHHRDLSRGPRDD